MAEIPDFSSWSRKQLQEEAKKFGIKANLKNADLIKKFQEIYERKALDSASKSTIVESKPEPIVSEIENQKIIVEETKDVVMQEEKQVENVVVVADAVEQPKETPVVVVDVVVTVEIPSISSSEQQSQQQIQSDNSQPSTQEIIIEQPKEVPVVVAAFVEIPKVVEQEQIVTAPVQIVEQTPAPAPMVEQTPAPAVEIPKIVEEVIAMVVDQAPVPIVEQTPVPAPMVEQTPTPIVVDEIQAPQLQQQKIVPASPAPSSFSGLVPYEPSPIVHVAPVSVIENKEIEQPKPELMSIDQNTTTTTAAPVEETQASLERKQQLVEWRKAKQQTTTQKINVAKTIINRETNNKTSTFNRPKQSLAPTSTNSTQTTSSMSKPKMSMAPSYGRPSVAQTPLIRKTTISHSTTISKENLNTTTTTAAAPSTVSKPPKASLAGLSSNLTKPTSSSISRQSLAPSLLQNRTNTIHNKPPMSTKKPAIPSSFQRPTASSSSSTQTKPPVPTAASLQQQEKQTKTMQSIKPPVPHFSHTSTLQKQDSVISRPPAIDWDKIHKKEFDKMDDLDVYEAKKQDRIQTLLTTTNKVQ